MYNICEHRASPLLSLIKCSYNMVVAVKKSRYELPEHNSFVDSNASTLHAHSPVLIGKSSHLHHSKSSADQTGDFGLRTSMAEER